MRFAKSVLAISVVFILLVGISQAAEVEKVKHPFLLWMADDLATLRRTIETEPWARKAYEAMVASKDRDGDELRHLFRYAVMGDREAGAVEKKRLVGLLKAPDPLGAALEWRILAYDLLHDQLTPEERAALEKRFRRYIEYAIKPGGAYDTSVYNNERNYARYDGEDGRYTRTNWLPNISSFPGRSARISQPPYYATSRSSARRGLCMAASNGTSMNTSATAASTSKSSAR